MERNNGDQTRRLPAATGPAKRQWNDKDDFRQQDPTHIMENIVYNELLICGYNVDVGVVEIFDMDKEGKRVCKQWEIDFVVNPENQRYYIQVAYDMTSEEKQTQ